MTRRRLISKVNRAAPALFAALFIVSVMACVVVAWAALAEGPKVTKRSSGLLALPNKPTRAMIALGDSLFNGPSGPGTCSVCHGKDGVGTRIGPRLAGAKHLGGIDSIARAIRVGVYWPPTLRGSMPSFEGVLDREQIWAVAAYVNSIAR
jgi:mono/diheme cytochrome c family protein